MVTVFVLGTESNSICKAQESSFWFDKLYLNMDNIEYDGKTDVSSTDPDLQQLSEVWYSKWRRVKEQLIPSSEISADFFCSLQGIGESPKPSTESNGGSPLQSCDNQTSLDLASLLNSSNIKRAEYKPAKLDQNSDTHIEDYVYYPNYEPVSLSEKTHDSVYWNPEEDGLYKGNSLEISKFNLNKIEQRIITEKKSLWFESAGELILSTNQILGKLSRYELNGPDPSTFTRIFSNGTSNEGIRTELAADDYNLRVFIKSLRFRHHHLFNEELFLVNKLLELFEKYETSEREGTLDLLAGKLNSHYELYDSEAEFVQQLENASSDRDGQIVQAHVTRLKQRRQQIAEVRQQLDDSYSTRRQLLTKILDAWREIKKVRAAQGYATSSLKLGIVREDVDQDDEERMFNAEVSRRMAELSDREQQESAEESSLTGSEDSSSSRRRKLIVADLIRTRGNPGEPNLKLVLKEADGSGSPDEKELKRRSEVSKLGYLLRVRFNGLEAACVPLLNLQDDFTVSVNQGFSLWLRQASTKLELELVALNSSARLKSNTVLARIPVPIPDSELRFEDSAATEVPFTCYGAREQPSADTGSLGTNVTFHRKNSSGELEEFKLQTHGTAVVQLGWASDENGRILSFPKRQKPPLETMAKLKEEVQLDPNDPANVPLLEIIEKLKQEKFAETSKLDSSAFSDGIFARDEDLESNARFRILSNRFQNQDFFSTLRMVPNRVCEIPQEIVKSLERETEKSHSSPVLEENISSLERARFRGRKFREKICQNILADLRKHKNRLTYEDIIAEDQIPTISTLGSNLTPIFSPKRPLRPVRKETSSVASNQLVVCDDVKLNVTVVRAMNVPLRKNSSNDSEAVPVAPYIEATFQKSVARTTTAVGSNPTWNQTLSLPVREFNSKSVVPWDQTTRDELFVQLFDEVSIDLPVNDSDDQTDSIRKFFKRCWLGSLRIPFASIYSQTKIEGCFELELPLLPLGYGLPAQSAATCLVLLIHLQPPVAATSLPRLVHSESMESEDFRNHLKTWHRDNLKLRKERAVDPLVLNSAGKSVYVGRYLQPLKPPPQLESSDSKEKLENICKFVAAIPCLQDSHNFRLWMSSQEMLENLCGTAEDHAVLLANFLLHENYQVSIVFGLTIPEGFAAHVLVKAQADESWLINPLTGRLRDLRRSNGPMKKLLAVLNRENFWINVQAYVEPSRVQLDLTKSSDWLPLFWRQFSNPFSVSVQPTELEYWITPEEEVRDFRERLVDIVRGEFMKWRKSSRTKWNRFASSVLQRKLEALENGLPDTSELEELCKTYKVFGVALRASFSDVDSLLDQLYATGLHRLNASEFALAVHVRAFVNNVLLVWIYAASLEKQLLM